MNFKYLMKWEELFNALPKYPDDYLPLAHLTEMGESHWDDGVAIVFEFEPSKEFHESNRCNLAVHLNRDETAVFELGSYSDNYDEFSELCSFKGSWKDAYIKVIAMMREGWPELIFPSDQEILLQDLT